MKKYILKASIVLITLIGVSISCSDEFINEGPEYSIDSENYFNSKEDYENALIGAYDLLQSSYLNVLLGEIASDNTFSGGESATDVVGIQQVDNMAHTAVNEQLKDIWDWMFAGVYRTSYILEFKDKTPFEGKNQIIAEARFLKAYYNFELVKWFGPIPIKIDERFSVKDPETIPRAPVTEVYANIESDLLFAIDNLSPTASQAGRATKGAAQALLGKVYLYQNKFINAANILDRVILDGNYSLVTDYNTLFENNNENNSESVFEIQYSDAQGANFDCLQCSEGNVAVGFSGIRNYDGPLFDSGYSFNVPTADVYNSFEIGDNRRDVAILNIVAWAAANSSWPNSQGGTGILSGEGYKHTGYFNRKYLPRKGDSNVGDQNLTNPNNYRAIRYADVLLMAAEALNRGGIDDGKARNYLNLVRRRAFGDLNHDITASGASLTEFILAERNFELVGEGHRFFDLVRTNKAAGTISGFTAGKNEVFPVPFEEIQFSNGNWTQNNNY